MLKDVPAAIYWQQPFIQYIHVTITVSPIWAPYEDFSSNTIKLPLQNFIDLAIYLS